MTAAQHDDERLDARSGGDAGAAAERGPDDARSDPPPPAARAHEEPLWRVCGAFLCI